MGLLARVERAVGRLNRWFGGAAIATQAETPVAPTQVRTLAATTVADEVDVATSPDAPGERGDEPEPPRDERAG